jgi:serine/threonine-protein kinase TTK/MPS1
VQKTGGDVKENNSMVERKEVGAEELILKINSLQVSSPSKSSSIDTRPTSKIRTELFPTSQKKPTTKAKERPRDSHATAGKNREKAAPLTLESRLPLSEIKNPSETPFKTFEQPLFVTPSMRAFSSIHANSMLSTIERDPIKQPMQQQQQPKILYRTPVARPFSALNAVTPMDSKPVVSASVQKLSPIKEPEKERPKENCITINSIEYEIDKKIGSGGSSSVFLARGRKSGKECAIKLVNLDGDSSVIEGYLNETRLLARLQGNINVVTLYDYCHMPDKKILYMVMEKGESDLHKVLQKFTAHIPLYTLMNYWYQMLNAVNYIHQNGVIHSDLKPANFCLVNGRLKLIDFGIASNIANDSTSIIKFTQAGTFNYISPEALIDTSNDESPSTHQPKIRLSTKSDVWSLGCILYLLLYKKTPFSHIKSLHQKMHALTDPQTPIDYPKLPNFYPEMLTDMLKKCLIHYPKQRSSVADLLKYPFNMIIPIDQ